MWTLKKHKLTYLQNRNRLIDTETKHSVTKGHERPGRRSVRSWRLTYIHYNSGKESACQCRTHRTRRVNPWVRKIQEDSWRRKWQPTPVFLPEESHGQRALAGYSPWGRKELDTTKHACMQYYI